MPPRDTGRHRYLLHLMLAVIIGFLGVALLLVYWSVLRARTILARDDNPRLFEAEIRLQRGKIFDQTDTILAENIGPLHNLQRNYPSPYAGPAVGYYSFTHGTAGSEEGFDSLLRGEPDDFRQRTLHEPQIGRDVRLALNIGLQETAVTQLNIHTGAILLLERPNDQEDYSFVRAMVSHPSYDPNQLDELFDKLATDADAPLLNRTTQGQYQPGLTLQPFILAAAIEQGFITLNEVVDDPDRSVAVEDTLIGCTSMPPSPATWADVLRHGCPAPMQELANQLGNGGLDKIFNDFGLTTDPILEIPTETTPDDPLVDPLMAGIGQDNLSVTPLQLAIAMSALDGRGTLPQPQIATAVHDGQGQWQPWQLEAAGQTAVSSSAARAIKQAMPQFERVRELNVPVLSGPEGSTNAWYMGHLADELSNWVVVVVVENISEGETAVAEEIGRTLLSGFLD